MISISLQQKAHNFGVTFGGAAQLSYWVGRMQGPRFRILGQGMSSVYAWGIGRGESYAFWLGLGFKTPLTFGGSHEEGRGPVLYLGFVRICVVLQQDADHLQAAVQWTQG